MIFEKMLNKIINNDCLEVLKDIPDASINLVLTDPPLSKKYCGIAQDRLKQSLLI